MGAILTCCSLGSCVVCGTVSCCGKTASIHSATVTRIVYFVLFLLTSIFAWVFSVWGAEIFGSFEWFTKWCGSHDTCANFLSGMAAYKVTFAFAGFHLILAALTFGVKDAHSFRGKLHNGWWGPKLIIWAGMIIGFLFLPPNFLTVYAWISMIGSIAFTVIQLFMLVDFAHVWNESWVGKYQETQNKNWFRLLLTVTLTLLFLCLVGSILMYVFLLGGSSCAYQTMNIAFITVNLACLIIACVMSVLPSIQEKNPRASLLTAAIVCTYATYLVVSAIFSEPRVDETCGFQNAAHNKVLKYLTLIIGALITFVAVAFSTVRAGSHSEDGERKKLLNVNGPYSDSEEEKQKREEEEDDIEVQKRKELEKHDRELLNLDSDHGHHEEHEDVVYNYFWFHIVMMLGSMYIGCLLTNWAIIDSSSILQTLSPTTSAITTPPVVQNSALRVDNSIVSVWLKMGSSWAVILLFVWTLIAPMVLTGRDFGF